MSAAHQDALRFIETHPEVFATFERLARDRIEAGWRRYSADAIFHRMRWDHPEIELNNDWTACFARVWLRRNPDWPRFFELRAAESDVLIESPQRNLFS